MTAPTIAYFLGRPAHVWIEIFSRPRADRTDVLGEARNRRPQPITTRSTASRSGRSALPDASAA
jgi:hypothetical protein